MSERGIYCSQSNILKQEEHITDPNYIESEQYITGPNYIEVGGAY